eukprot:scaffold162033_cov19-Tisochrysis_lutea.AAC.1
MAVPTYEGSLAEAEKNVFCRAPECWITGKTAHILAQQNRHMKSANANFHRDSCEAQLSSFSIQCAYHAHPIRSDSNRNGPGHTYLSPSIPCTYHTHFNLTIQLQYMKRCSLLNPLQAMVTTTMLVYLAPHPTWFSHKPMLDMFLCCLRTHVCPHHCQDVGSCAAPTSTSATFSFSSRFHMRHLCPYPHTHLCLTGTCAARNATPTSTHILRCKRSLRVGL